MKKMLMLILTVVSLGAEQLYPTTKDGAIEIRFNSDMPLVTFCRNGLQWVAISGGNRAGLALDAVPVDKNDPTKGVKPIFCRGK